MSRGFFRLRPSRGGTLRPRAQRDLSAPTLIPRVTHQTAATEPKKGPLGAYRRKLVDLHPGWDHRFYDDESCRDLVSRELGYLLPLYDAFSTPVQRADLFRVAVLYARGGFYLDLDMECHQPLDALLSHACVLAEEMTLTEDEARGFGVDHRLRIANYMFGSAARHPFWLELLEGMLRESQRPLRSDNEILEATGPGLLTRVFHRTRDRYPDIVVTPNGGARCPRCRLPRCCFGPFATHHHLASWRGQLDRVAPTRSTVGLAEEDRQAIRRHLRHASRRQDHGDRVVLRTYSGESIDGLSSVFAQLGNVGPGVDDSRHLAGKKVLVPGIPFLYTDRLSPDNINVVFTTFESSELPGHWVRAINDRYHGCIVPHAAIREVFERSGVAVPVHVIQLGYRRCPRRRATPSPATAAPFRVGFLGVPVRRKNLHLLYDACHGLRPRIPELRLAIHVSHLYDWVDARPLRRLRAVPWVEWSEGVKNEEELGRWYGELSCYAFPSSGEGWSFTPRESLYLGIPTVLTDIPVHRELAESGYCHVISGRGSEPATFEGGVFGEWLRLSADDIAEALLEVHRDRDAARRRAREGSRWIESRWLASDLEIRVGDLLDAL